MDAKSVHVVRFILKYCVVQVPSSLCAMALLECTFDCFAKDDFTGSFFLIVCPRVPSVTIDVRQLGAQMSNLRRNSTLVEQSTWLPYSSVGVCIAPMRSWLRDHTQNNLAETAELGGFTSSVLGIPTTCCC